MYVIALALAVVAVVVAGVVVARAMTRRRAAVAPTLPRERSHPESLLADRPDRQSEAEARTRLRRR
jgi:hypothetical protein